MKSRLKKFLKVLTIITVIIIISLASFLIYLNSSAGQNFIKNVITAQIENNLDLNAEIGILETNIFSYFNLSQINIYPDKEGASSPLLKIKRLELKYNIYDLIFAGKRINYILVDSISLFVKRDSLGVFNLPDFSVDTDTESDSTFKLPVKIDLAEIKNVFISYDDDFILANGTCSNLDIKIERTGSENLYRIKTSFDLLTLKYFEHPVEMNKFSLDGLFRDDLTMKPVSIKSSLSGLELNGSLSSGTGNISGDFNISGNPQRLINTVSGFNSSDLSDFINTKITYKIYDYTSSPKIDLNIFMPHYKVNGISINNLQLEGHFASDTLRLTNLSLGILDGTVSSSGWVTFNNLFSHEFSMNISKINLRNPELNPAGAYIKKPLHTDLNLNSRGNLSDLDSRITNSVFRVYTDSSDILNASVFLKDRYLTIESDSSPVAVHSGISFYNNRFSGRVNINLTNLNSLSSLINFNGIKGTINSFSSIAGSLSEFNIKTNVNSEGIYYNNIKIIDTLAASLSMENNNIFVDSSLVYGEIKDLDNVASGFGLNGTKGELAYSFSGTLKYAEPEFTFRAQMNEPGIGPISLDSTDLTVRLRKDTISVSNFKITKDSVAVITDGVIHVSDLTGNFKSKLYNGLSNKYDSVVTVFAYNSPRDYKIRIRSDNLKLETFNSFIPGLELSSGNLNMDLNVINSDNSLTAYLPFTVSNLKRKGLIINSVTGQVGIENNYIEADSLIIQTGSNYTGFNSKIELQKDAGGNYFIDENSRTEGRLYGNNLELAMLNPFIEDYASISGTGDLAIVWNGQLSNPHLNGKADITNSSINTAESINLLSRINGSINFKDSVISIKNMSAEFDDKSLSINSEIKKTDNATLSAVLEILSDETPLIDGYAKLNRDYISLNLGTNNLNIDAAGIFFPFMRDVKGVLSSRLLIEGAPDNPGITGTLKVKDISYNPEFMDIDVSNGQITAHIDNSMAVLDTVLLNIGKGRLSADGHLFYNKNEIKDINLNINGSDIMLSEPDYFTLKINSVNLNLLQQDQRYKLGGTVQFGTSRYTQDFELANLWEILIAKTEGVIENKSSEEPLDLTEYIEDYQLKLINLSDYFKKLDLDLAIRNSDSIWVKNNVADFRVHPDLTLRGSIETPLLSGRVTVEEDGKIIFLDREFDLKEGIVEFENPERINPYLNLSAESDVTGTTDIEDEEQTYHINLNLAGPLDDFDFNMTSDPALESIDIISLLTIGMTYQQLQASQDVNSALKDRAGVLTTLALSNNLNEYYQEWLGDFLKIDRVGIGGNVFSPGEARLEFTKRWSDRVEISYSTAVDNLEQQILKAKLKLIRYFYLEGQTDQQNESGIDLIFRYKFK